MYRIFSISFGRDRAVCREILRGLSGEFRDLREPTTKPLRCKYERKLFANFFGNPRNYLLNLAPKPETICKSRQFFLQSHLLGQDGAQSQEVQRTIRAMKRELGLEPFGDLEPYTRTECPKGVRDALNKREKTSMDINAALLEETCFFNRGLDEWECQPSIFNDMGLIRYDCRFKFKWVSENNKGSWTSYYRFWLWPSFTGRLPSCGSSFSFVFVFLISDLRIENVTSLPTSNSYWSSSKSSTWYCLGS